MAQGISENKQYAMDVFDTVPAKTAYCILDQFMQATQTPEELKKGLTIEQNGIGLRQFDAGKASRIIKEWKRTGKYWADEVAWVRKMLPRYHKQLIEGGYI